MRTGAYAQQALRAAGADERAGRSRPSTGSGSRRSAARGRWASTTRIGSIEAGKEADLIAVDPGVTAPLGPDLDDAGLLDDPALLVSRLIFRAHPDMVRAAWVRGRQLEGTVVIDARFGHVNVIARDWRSLATFYTEVFGCTFVPPERDISGPVLERGTGIPGAALTGAHLRLPGSATTVRRSRSTSSR